MILVFDLDGTLCTTIKKPDGGWAYTEAKPIQERINEVNRLFKEGHTIIIDTARGCTSGFNWTLETAQQLVAWGVKYHILRAGQKVGGDLYIDDRGIRADQFFKDTMAWVKSHD